MMMTGVVTSIMMMVTIMRRRRELFLVWMANEIAITHQIHLLCQVGSHQMMVVSRILVIVWRWSN